MARRLARIASVICILAGSIMGAPSPASASMTGEIVFVCRAELASFPSSGLGACHDDSLVLAAAQVSVQGLAADGQPFVVDGVGRIIVEFGHSTTCVASEPPAAWTMHGGSLYVLGVPAFHAGQQTQANLYLEFTATVIGTDITFTTYDHELSLIGTGPAVGNLGGVGKGSFTPLIGEDNTCPTGGPMEALIEGEINLPL